MSDPLIIAGQQFSSRLFLGSAGYPNRKIMLDSIAASGSQMVTASIRRISLAGDDESLIDLLAGRVRFLPNTAGCQTAKDAVLTAELAREALDTNWIKLEVIGDRELLYPDVEELIRATETLVAKSSRTPALRPSCRSARRSVRDWGFPIRI
jgi:thiazole synthase